MGDYSTHKMELKIKANLIRKISAYSAYKGYRTFNTVVGRKLNYLMKSHKHNIRGDYFTLLKDEIKHQHQ